MGLTLAAGMAIGMMASTVAEAREVCSGSGSERICRDVRADGSAPPGYRASDRPSVNYNDPNLKPGGAGSSSMYTPPGRLNKLPQ
jgi:hypothetical protein